MKGLLYTAAFFISPICVSYTRYFCRVKAHYHSEQHVQTYRILAAAGSFNHIHTNSDWGHYTPYRLRAVHN